MRDLLDVLKLLAQSEIFFSSHKFLNVHFTQPQRTTSHTTNPSPQLNPSIHPGQLLIYFTTTRMQPTLGYAFSTSVAPAQASIMSQLAPADVLALSSVSKEIRKSTQDGLSMTTHNINLHLKKFFKDPEYFRWIQAQSGALIGGDFARAFFDNSTDTVDKLDLYVHRIDGKHEKAFNLLIGYITQTGDGGSGWAAAATVDYSKHGSAEFVYEKRTKSGKTLCIAVHPNAYEPLYRLLYEAPTTASLNIVAWNRAYALYPQHTFVEKVAHILRNPIRNQQDRDAWFQSQLVNLKKADMKTLCLDWSGVEDCALTRIRRIGDKYTWCIDLDISNIQPHTGPKDQVLESATLQIREFKGMDAERGPFDRYTMGVTPHFTHPILRHVYLGVSPPVKDNGWTNRQELCCKLDTLAQNLTDTTRLKLMKLPVNKRPPQAEYDVFMNRQAGDTPSGMVWEEGATPEAWSFYDDLLVKRLKKLWKEYESKMLAEEKGALPKEVPGRKEEKKVDDGWDDEPSYPGDI